MTGRSPVAQQFFHARLGGCGIVLRKGKHNEIAINSQFLCQLLRQHVWLTLKPRGHTAFALTHLPLIVDVRQYDLPDGGHFRHLGVTNHVECRQVVHRL